MSWSTAVRHSLTIDLRCVCSSCRRNSRGPLPSLGTAKDQYLTLQAKADLSVVVSDRELLTVGTFHWDEKKQLFKKNTVENCCMLNRMLILKINILISNAQLLIKYEMSYINSDNEVTLQFSGWLYCLVCTVVIGSHHNVCVHNDLFHLHVFVIPASSDLNPEAFI